MIRFIPLVIMILSIMILSGMIPDGHSGFHLATDIPIMVMDIPTAGLIIPIGDHHTAGETLIITDIMGIMIIITDMVMVTGILMEAITDLCITDHAVPLKITVWPVPHSTAAEISAVRA
jgi:hypothetical protein